MAAAIMVCAAPAAHVPRHVSCRDGAERESIEGFI